MKHAGALFAQLADEVGVVKELLLGVQRDEANFATIGAARSLLSQIGLTADDAAASLGAERAIGGAGVWLDQFSALAQLGDAEKAHESGGAAPSAASAVRDARLLPKSGGVLLRDFTPLAEVSSAERHKRQRAYGMHAPRLESRCGTDAFDVRSDVTVGDAVTTLGARLSMVAGVLAAAQANMDNEGQTADAVYACQALIEEASGMVALLATAVFNPGNFLHRMNPAAKDANERGAAQ